MPVIKYVYFIPIQIHYSNQICMHLVLSMSFLTHPY